MKRIELYLIGERITRLQIISFILISVLIGICLGILVKSLIVGIIGVFIIGILFILITRKYYWIISHKGIYTPLNFGVRKYLLVVIQYIFLGHDMCSCVFINYRSISCLNIVLRSKDLEIQMVRKDGKRFSIVVMKELFNQDLINSINYIKRKGITINGYSIINNIDF